MRTPALLVVTEVDAERLALAFARVPRRSLDVVPPEQLPDDVLRAVWRLIADLHRAGIGHRDLRLANVVLDDGGAPWLVGFASSASRTSSASAARPEQAAGGVAVLLPATAAAVGGPCGRCRRRRAPPRAGPGRLAAPAQGRAVRQHPSLSILERRRELGLLRIIGMTDDLVRRMVRLKSVLIAVLGPSPAWSAGWWWRWPWSSRSTG